MANNKQEEPKYIEFHWAGYSKSGTTETWRVMAKENPVQLGLIKWDGPWRCYSFFIYPSLFADKDDFLKYEKVCLRDIANFCEKVTLMQREKKLGHQAHPESFVNQENIGLFNRGKQSKEGE
ncbi:MAG: hypothetical protein WC325_13420 [Candidatus Bathyarchaeia archaeon]|jgi:hypothetical protein